MILHSCDVEGSFRSVEVNGYHTVVVGAETKRMRCLYVRESDGAAVFGPADRKPDGQITIPFTEWSYRILDLRPPDYSDNENPATRQSDPEIANLFRIGKRWGYGEEPTDADLDAVYDGLDKLTSMVDDLQEIIRLREGEISEITGEPIRDSIP